MSMLVLGIASVVLIDQISKRAIARRLAEREIGWRRSIVVITRVTAGRRTSAGIAHTSPLVGLWVVAVLGTVLYARFGATGALAQLSLGAAIGGATSNLFDRVWRGGIVDFIAVGSWPTFNLADAAIVGGVLLAVCVTG